MRWRAREVVPARDTLCISYDPGGGAEVFSIEIDLPAPLLARLELWLHAQGIARI
jgi:hypothetical protein